MQAKHRLARLLGSSDPRLPAVLPAGPEPIHVQTAQDVLDLLEEQINAVREASRAGPLAKAAVLGRLAGLALKAVEVSQLAARLEMLEAVLKKRNAEADQ